MLPKPPTSDPGVLATIRDALGALGGESALTAMLVLAAVGAVCMAIVQVIKELTPLRASFQRWWVEKWIAMRAHKIRANPHRRVEKTCASCAVSSQLVELATGGLPTALYELPAEEMTREMIAAAQVTLDDPGRYSLLLAVLASDASGEDLKAVRKGQPVGASTQAYFEARNRVTRRIERNMVGIKLAMGSRWKFLMQVMALAITVVIVEITVIYSDSSNMWKYAAAIPIGLIGGYFAPIAHDLLVLVQNFRKR